MTDVAWGEQVEQSDQAEQVEGQENGQAPEPEPTAATMDFDATVAAFAAAQRKSARLLERYNEAVEIEDKWRSNLKARTLIDNGIDGTELPHPNLTVKGSEVSDEDEAQEEAPRRRRGRPRKSES